MVSDTHFQSHFFFSWDAKAPGKWKLLTTWWPCAHSHQAYWRLRINDVNPYDTSLLSHHEPIRELCLNWLHTLWPLHPPRELETHPGALGLGALAALDSSFGVLQETLHSLHHIPAPVDWLHRRQANTRKFGSLTVIFIIIIERTDFNEIY